MAAQMSIDDDGTWSDALTQLRRTLDSLVGCAPQRVNVGTAWHFSLDWGNNAAGQVSQKTGIEGEYRLLVTGSWRLDGPDQVICSWRNFDRADDNALRSLAGRRVVSVNVTLPGHDLTMEFEEARTLRVFFDRDSAFVFFTREYAFGVDSSGRLEFAR